MAHNKWEISTNEPRTEDFANSPEGQYRRLQAIAFDKARTYSGSEADYDALMAALSDWEDFIEARKDTFEDDDDIEAREALVAFALNPDNPKDINDAIDVASTAQLKAMAAALAAEFGTLEDEASSFVVEKFGGVFFPPGTQEITTDAGEGAFEIKFDDIVHQLTTLLEQYKVFADDMIITIGEEPKEMMRKVSYCKVEIPRLHRTVMLCNQVGEGTRVIRGAIANERLAQLTKEELDADATIDSKMIRRGSGWSERMAAVLLSDDEWGTEQSKEKEKTNVRELHKARLRALAYLRGEFSADEWPKMKRKRLNEIAFEGLSPYAVAKLLGTDKNPQTTVGRLQLACMVYPEDTVLRKELAIETRTIDEWRAAIVEKYKVENFVPPTVKFSRGFEVDGRKLMYVTRKFGIKENPYANKVAQLELATKIFPDNAEVQAAYMAQKELADHEAKMAKRSVAEWQQALLAAGRGPEWWVSATQDQAEDFSVDGTSMEMLSRHVGLKLYPERRRTDRIRLAKALFPEDPGVDAAMQGIQAAEAKRTEQVARSAADWRPFVEAESGDATWWLNAKQPDVKGMKIDGATLPALAKMLGVKGDPQSNQRARVELAVKFFPENAELVQEFDRRKAAEQLAQEVKSRTPEQWRARVQEEYPEDWWMTATSEDKLNFKVDGKKIIGMARIFGVSGYPQRTRKKGLELACAIFPDSQRLHDEFSKEV